MDVAPHQVSSAEHDADTNEDGEQRGDGAAGQPLPRVRRAAPSTWIQWRKRSDGHRPRLGAMRWSGARTMRASACYKRVGALGAVTPGRPIRSGTRRSGRERVVRTTGPLTRPPSPSGRGSSNDLECCRLVERRQKVVSMRHNPCGFRHGLHASQVVLVTRTWLPLEDWPTTTRERDLSRTSRIWGFSEGLWTHFR
jgi:hypothetical protein